MNSRGRKLLDLVVSKNKHLLDLPKYETTKGTNCGEQLVALNLINVMEDVLNVNEECNTNYSIMEKDCKASTEKNQKKQTQKEDTLNVDEEFNINTSILEKDYEASTEEEISSGTEYIPESPEIEYQEDIIVSDENNIHNEPNIIDKSTNNFEASTSKVEQFTNTRSYTKKNACPYCVREFTHFPRHLERNHKEEPAVTKLLSMSLRNPERKKVLGAIRKEGNFILNSITNVIRPVRRPKGEDQDTIPNLNNFKNQYIACKSCLGYYSRNYLRRHRKICPLRIDVNQEREQHLSAAQLFAICSGPRREFYANLRLKEEVFPTMRNDEFSRTAMEDILICSYAETLLRKHKRPQIKSAISNKMRELGRLLITLKSIIGIESLFEALKPEAFQNIVAATKVISGYNPETRSFKASSLALHMGTTLKQVCDIANKLIIEKNCLLPCTDQEHCLKEISRLRQLLENHWNTELASLALKNLNENKYMKPKMLPVTSDVIKFETSAIKRAKDAQLTLKDGKGHAKDYRELLECVLGLTLLLNRKRIGEIEHLTIKTYNSTQAHNQQEEFLESLTESEKILSKSFKRVVTLGKGSKPVAILFPKQLQDFIDVLLNVRDLFVPKENEYLFANPKAKNHWLNGYQTLKKLARESEVSDASLFTSTRLRKQIATILQVLNVTENEMEQFAAFLGHTKKTHENYYRLPQDIYQTAKVSKLLLAINSGKGHMYKGKSLDQIEFSDNLVTDSDADEDNINTDEHRTNKKKLFKKKNNRTVEQCSDNNSDLDIIECTSKKMPVDDIDLDTNSHFENNECISNKMPVDETETEWKIEKPQKKKKSANSRLKWTKDQKKVVDDFFKNHIKNKQAPKKHEVVELISQHEKLFQNRNWVTIKAYVYNCYKTKD